MLRTDKPIYKVILVFNLLLIAAAVVLSIIGINGEGATLTRMLATVVRLFALLFAGFYLLSGYSKNAAKYYKTFGIIYALTIVVGIITCITNTVFVMDIICSVLLLIGILVLVSVKNLGKTKSFVICAFLVALQIACVVLVYLEGDPIIVKIDMFMGVDLACLYGIMTYAKYLDKAERGTK